MSLPPGAFELQYPQSVGEFKTYEDAQAAVDYLADNDFPVQNLMIVGTNLRSLERVTGRRTWGSVLMQGAGSGIGTGLFVGLMLLLFIGGDNPAGILLAGLALGIAFGVATSAAGYAFTRGKRDFASTKQVLATSYEVLSEHKVAVKAREMLAQRPGARAQLFE